MTAASPRTGTLAIAAFCGAIQALVGCSAPPPAVRGAPPPPAVTASAVASTHPPLPAPPAIWIEGEGLSPVVDVGFSADGAVLFVKRKDASIEAWDPARGTLIEGASAAEIADGRLPGNPFSRMAAASPPPTVDRERLSLSAIEGVDDKPFVAWARKVGLQVTASAEEIKLWAPSELTVAAGPGGRIVLVQKGGALDIAHRAAHTHFAVSGWTKAYSSRYGYAGDDTTWPGDVSASFGPLEDQLVLRSTAARSLYFEYAASRLYDPRKGKRIADLDEETCQPNDLVWSPLGKYIVRQRCMESVLLLSDAATGAALPSRPGEMPVAFGPGDATLASVYDGTARVAAIGDVEPRMVVPGPVGLRKVAIGTDGASVAVLRGDGLDVWDLASGGPVVHTGTPARPNGAAPARVLAAGKWIPDGDGTQAAASGCGERPAFSPKALEEACAKSANVGAPVWGATATLLVAGLEPPILTRAKDGKSLSLHSFAYGTGRATIVVDEAGRWDANDLGASLVHVSVGAAEDDAEKTRRHTPGLLTAFARGD